MSAGEMIINELLKDGVCIIELHGRLDSLSAKHLCNKILSMPLHGRESVVLDMHGVVFVDSTGVGNLVAALYSTREYKTAIALAALQPHVLDALKIVRLDKVFDIFGTVDDAATHLASRTGTV